MAVVHLTYPGTGAEFLLPPFAAAPHPMSGAKFFSCDHEAGASSVRPCIGFRRKRKRTRTFSVWKSFTYLPSPVPGVEDKAACNKCSTKLCAGGEKYGTSHLRRHIDRCYAYSDDDDRRLSSPPQLRRQPPAAASDRPSSPQTAPGHQQVCSPQQIADLDHIYKLIVLDFDASMDIDDSSLSSTYIFSSIKRSN